MEKPRSNPAIAPTSAAPSNASGAKPRVAAPEKGTLVKKKNTASGDPYAQPKPARPNVLSPGRNGARYGIRVGFQATVAPEAGSTQANGRIIAPAMNRSREPFQEGMAE